MVVCLLCRSSQPAFLSPKATRRFNGGGPYKNFVVIGLVGAQNGGTPAHDSGGAQLGGFIQNPRSCESQRANSKAAREDPPRGASGRGLDSVTAIFSLNGTLKPAKHPGKRH